MTSIEGVSLTRLKRFADDRGYFSEILRADDFPVALKQASHSRSRRGVLRGLHFHQAQWDLWYLVGGRAQVALVDLRRQERAPQVATFVLDEAEAATLLIPPGIAHGYLALTDIDMLYWTSHEFDPQDEYGIAWNDPQLGIDWSNPRPIVSERDRRNPPLTWSEIPSF